MSEPTKEELLDFMRKHGPEKVDSITDTESAIRHFRCTSKIYKEQRDQYKAERDTLIDDLSWYKAKVSRLEENNDKLNELFNYQENKKKEYREVIEKLECKNRDYKVANRNLADYDHEWKNEYVKLENKTKTYKSLLYEFSQHIGNKPSSRTYKYFRAKLDELGIKEGD